MSDRDYSPGSRRQPSEDEEGWGGGRATSGERSPESPRRYDHHFSLSEQDSRAKPSARASGVKIMLAVLSLECSMLRMQLEREQRQAGWRAITNRVGSEVGEYGKENFDEVAKELLYNREKAQELAFEVSKLKNQNPVAEPAVAPLVPRTGGASSVLDRLHKVQIQKDVQHAAQGPWIYDQKFTDVRKRTLLVHSAILWVDYSRKCNAGSTQLGMLGSLGFAKWYLLTRFKLSAEEGDPGPSGGVFTKVWDRFRKELKAKKVYPSIGLPKAKYSLEREAFDYERLVFHRRKFRNLMRSILRNQNRRFKLLLVIGYFKLIANSGLLAMKDHHELKQLTRLRPGGEDNASGSGSPRMRRRTTSVNPREIFAPLDGRRSKLYSMSSKEFPYNISQSRNANMPALGRGWNGDGDVVESSDQRREREASLQANKQVRAKLVRQASDARVGLARKYLARQKDWGTQEEIGNEGDGADDLIGTERFSARQSSQERLQMLKRNYLLDDKGISRRPSENRVLMEAANSPIDNVMVLRQASLRSALSVFQDHYNRRNYHYLLKWLQGVRLHAEAGFLSEFENVSIVLSERAFREKVFRTKIKVLQETLATQIREFESALVRQKSLASDRDPYALHSDD